MDTKAARVLVEQWRERLQAKHSLAVVNTTVRPEFGRQLRVAASEIDRCIRDVEALLAQAGAPPSPPR